MQKKIENFEFREQIFIQSKMDTVQGTTGPGSRDGEKFPTRTITKNLKTKITHNM